MKKNILYKGKKIFYRKESNGFPIVLLHGFGEDGSIWDLQIDFLKNDFEIIIPDLPGSGKSEMLYGNILIEDYADCIKALLDDGKIENCIMLGHSMGGYVTLAFAEKYPAYLKGFGLIHSTAFTDSDEKKEIRKRSIETIKEYGAYNFLKTTTPNLFGEKFKKENPGEVDKLIEAGNNFKGEALMQYYKTMMLRPCRTDVLKQSSVPVLFVMGAEDKAAPVNDLLQQVHLPQVSYFHILENAGHMGIWEAADEMNKFIFEFAHEII